VRADDGMSESGKLILRAVEGDREALEKLLREHHPQLLRYARQKMSEALRAAGDPDDVVQEAAIRVFRSIKKFQRGHDLPGSFAAWLRGIVDRVILGLVRNERRGLERLDDELLGNLPGSSSTAGRRAARREAILLLGEALIRLSPRSHEIVRLHYLEGLTMADIGERMGLERGAVNGVLQRARAELRELLGSSSNYFLSSMPIK